MRTSGTSLRICDTEAGAWSVNASTMINSIVDTYRTAGTRLPAYSWLYLKMGSLRSLYLRMLGAVSYIPEGFWHVYQ